MPTPASVVALVSLLVVLLMMAAELWISRRHERTLREAGAIEPMDDVYATMQWAYPGAFVVMAAEGAVFGPMPGTATVAGAALLAASKALKFWAITALGTRWTFRVLVLPDAPLVATGPYVFLRHPNYVAVIGELISMILLVGAPLSGTVTTLLFMLLLRRRIKIEDRALRHPPCT